ncbi:MAG: Sec-independent protein translocase protein TatB [Pseudomonadota bacterium]
MFDIGFLELVLLAVVGIVVIGPEQLPAIIKKIMLWHGRLKRQFTQVRSQIEDEIGADEIRQQLYNETILSELDSGKKIVNDLQHDLDSFHRKVSDGNLDEMLSIEDTSSMTKDETPNTNDTLNSH